MNKFLLTFTLVLGMCFQMTAQTITWDGDAGDGLWTSPTNWDTDVVPSATDDVDLDGSSVTLTANAQVQRVFADGSGVFTVASGVTLTIDNNLVTDDGNGALEIQGSATLVNNGTISISNTAGTNNGHGFYNKGITNNSGTITIDGVNVHGLYVVAGTFTNAATGSITVTNVGITDSAGDNIYTDDANSGTLFSTLINDGMISVTMTSGDDGVYVNDASSFVNNGTLTVNGAASGNNEIPLHIADNNSVFTNTATGFVDITAGGEYGIQVDGDNDAAASAARIMNDGAIMVAPGTDDGIRVRRVGQFFNNAGATLTITGGTDEGIQIDDSAGSLSTFTNSGTIDIITAGDHGMELFGTFKNMTTGVFKSTNAIDDGMNLVAGSTFENDGTISIDGSGNQDIEVNGSTFTHTANAKILPGSSPGDMVIKDPIDLGAATLVIEIDGTTAVADYDQIQHGNSADLVDMSAAKVDLQWGFVPAVGDCFTIFSKGGSGNTVTPLAGITSSNPAIVYTVDYDNNDIEICVTQLLPVELTSFEGKMESSTSLLSWETQTEENNNYFEVQYSTDGREFSTIDMVAGNGTTTEIQNYEYTHKNVRSIDNYYRLKQVDFDGEFAYSDIIYLKNDTRDTPVAIFPNPAHEEISYEGVEASLTFYDIQGRQVMQQVAQGERTTIDISRLKSGVYTIEVLTNTGHKTFEKLIKE